MAGIKEAIEDRVKVWKDHVNEQNLAAATTMYTEDCLVLPHGENAFIGRPAVLDSLKGLVENGASRVEEKVEDIQVLGDEAAVSYSIMTTYTADGSLFAVFKRLIVWKKEGDVWMKFRDVLNLKP